MKMSPEGSLRRIGCPPGRHANPGSAFNSRRGRDPGLEIVLDLQHSVTRSARCITSGELYAGKHEFQVRRFLIHQTEYFFPRNQAEPMSDQDPRPESAGLSRSRPSLDGRDKAHDAPLPIFFRNLLAPDTLRRPVWRTAICGVNCSRALISLYGCPS